MLLEEGHEVAEDFVLLTRVAGGELLRSPRAALSEVGAVEVHTATESLDVVVDHELLGVGQPGSRSHIGLLVLPGLRALPDRCRAIERDLKPVRQRLGRERSDTSDRVEAFL